MRQTAAGNCYCMEIPTESGGNPHPGRPLDPAATPPSPTFHRAEEGGVTAAESARRCGEG